MRKEKKKERKKRKRGKEKKEKSEEKGRTRKWGEREINKVIIVQ